MLASGGKRSTKCLLKYQTLFIQIPKRMGLNLSNKVWYFLKVIVLFCISMVNFINVDAEWL